jgi:glycosyltransferase involved in cell wall biosynthesis
VSKQKNVDVVVDAFNLLAAKYSNIYLDIVGNCTEPTYAEEIKRHISASEFTNRITMHPACSHDRLKEHLADKHFYVFPTTEPREGHSNALTEAMAWGLIPVATDIGFNRAIVGDDMLIVKQLSAKAFDDIIANVVDSGKIQEQSERAYHRIQSNYTEDIVYNRLKEEYNTLFSLCHTTRES